jgi:hypothetical protein
MTMTQPQIFITMLTTVLFCVSGAREIRRRNFGLGITLIAVPVCGWLSHLVTS